MTLLGNVPSLVILLHNYMYHHVTRCNMQEAEPRLYWRVKVNGKWKWITAIYDLNRGACAHPLGEEVILWWPSAREIYDREGDVN